MLERSRAGIRIGWPVVGTGPDTSLPRKEARVGERKTQCRPLGACDAPNGDLAPEAPAHRLAIIATMLHV